MSDGERYIIPLDEILGMRGENVTGCLREIVSYCASQMSYEVTGRIVKKLCGVELCNREIELIVKGEGKRIREKERKEIEEFWESYGEEELGGYNSDSIYYIGLDGTMVHSRENKYRQEGKVAVIYRDDQIVEVSEGRKELLGKRYTATFGSSEELGEQMYKVAYERGVEGGKEVVILGDGARWVKELQEFYFPEGRYILDWYHLERRVREAIEEMRISEEERERKKEEIREELWEGRIEGAIRVIRGIGEEERGEKVEELIRYMRNNEEGIVNYKELREKGYHVGSGSIEKGIDVVIVKREKKGGMIWSRKGADSIARLRVKIFNGEWDDYWNERLAA